ncbi:MAG: CPXCG motif-containing cysteine-rich protein [Pseudomonadota bacterium]
MNDPLQVRSIDCPFCGEPNEIVLDLSAGGQDYIEDCQVCCQPIQIRFEVAGDMLAGIDIGRAD